MTGPQQRQIRDKLLQRFNPSVGAHTVKVELKRSSFLSSQDCSDAFLSLYQSVTKFPLNQHGGPGFLGSPAPSQGTSIQSQARRGRRVDSAKIWAILSDFGLLDLPLNDTQVRRQSLDEAAVERDRLTRNTPGREVATQREEMR